jgi:hypothetical protein
MLWWSIYLIHIYLSFLGYYMAYTLWIMWQVQANIEQKALGRLEGYTI